MAFTHYILVCGGTGCESSNADLIYKNLKKIPNEYKEIFNTWNKLTPKIHFSSPKKCPEKYNLLRTFPIILQVLY